MISTPRRPQRSALLLWILLFMSILCSVRSFAHPADIQYLRIQLSHDHAKLRFTFNLLTLSRFIPELDGNRDGQLQDCEWEAAKPKLLHYLGLHVHLSLNEKPTLLPTSVEFQRLWPDAESAVAAADFPARHVDVSFQCEANPVLDSLGLHFSFWKEAGPQATLEATFEQENLRTKVPFSMTEPDYLYHTGYSVDGLFQEPSMKPMDDSKRIPAEMPWVMILVVAGVAMIILQRGSKKPS